MQPTQILTHLTTDLAQTFGMHPVLAVEIEFYLHGTVGAEETAVLAWLDAEMRAAGITAHPAEKERAPEQYEIALPPTRDAVALAENTRRLKVRLIETAPAQGWRADFAAKAFAERSGSGLHLHIHLEDVAGTNLFTRESEGEYSPPLRHSLAGLLALLPACMPFFAPNAESYARFVPPTAKTNCDAPTHLCWGPNNRTAALRLPNKPLDRKHIEHRVAGADADSGLALAALLMGVHHGLQHRLLPPEPLHGLAYKAQYGLEKLPESLDAAMALMQASTVLHEYQIPFPHLVIA